MAAPRSLHMSPSILAADTANLGAAVAAVQAALAYAARAMRNDVVWEMKLSA